ncbi:nitrogen regulation protein NR(II) [Candidatus Lokiarchaeum ossiferum]|uniref:nitrogen regulation protein NR(II) n=1 Tax=Candidatus Lokiarchaeum ossiferum TaxID=2951803 RepID=UPI00352E0C82
MIELTMMIFFNCISIIILLLIDTYMYISFKDTSFKLWNFALISYLIFIFTQFFFDSESPSPYLYLLRMLMLILATFLMNAGVQKFVGRTPSISHFINLGLAAIWLCVGVVYIPNLNLISVPIFISLDISLFIGLYILQKFYSNGFELRLNFVVTILWAINYICFPLIDIYKEKGVIFDSVNVVFILFQGLSFILMHSHRRNEELLKESSRLIMTINHLTDGLLILNLDHQIALMNQKAEIMTGIRYSEAKAHLLEDVYITRNLNDKDTHSTYFDEKLKDPTSKPSRECYLISKDKQKRIISESVRPTLNFRGELTGFIILFRDITKLSYFEEESVISRNLDSISTLAGGIAHDFNNILTSIIGNISIIKEEDDLDPEKEEIVNDIESAAYRAKKLANQYLTFAEGGNPIKKLVEPVKLVKNLIDELLHNSNISYDVQVKTEIWPIKFDKEQMELAISNLIINALESMPNSGLLTIIFDNIAIPNNSDFGLVSDNYVQISITDTGIGIQPENIMKVFDPYYTTKSDHKGIGLPTTYSIIKKHNGNIKLQSEVGVGTSISFFLPAVIQN